MSLFKKKPVEDINAEEAEMKNNVGTMQDDIAGAIKKKNHSGIFPNRFKSQKDEFITGRSKSIQRDLAGVYTDTDGQVPDLTKLDKSERPLWQTILYSLVAVFSVLLVISVIGFFVYTNLNQASFTNERVLFKIEPPISVTAGQDQVYTIIISNNEKVNLYNVNISLLYPDSFHYVSGTPEATSDNNNSWDISVLKVGETKEIKLTGKINAAINSAAVLSGTLTFKPENMNADFNQKASIDLGVNSSVLQMTVEGEEKVLANRNTEYVITIKNVGPDIIKDIEVTAEIPQGFVIASSTPNAKDGSNNIWTIDKIASSTPETATTTQKQIKIRGNYSGIADSGNQEFKVRATIKNGGNPLLMAEQTAVTTVVKDMLSLSLVINGSAVDSAVSFGDLLFYTLTYKNTGQEELKNISVSANLNSEVLDWDTLLDNNKGVKKGSAITWTGKEVSKLLSLRPGEEGEISWQIRVSDLASLNQSNLTKYSIESFAEAKVGSSQGGTDMITGKTITNSINSDLSLQAGARYYDEDNIALGAGPIAPKSGSASSYNIKLSLSNNLHNIGNIIVTATLPKNVNWDNKETHNTGDVAYSDKARKVTWMISKLPKLAPTAEANFNVSITPLTGDIGRVLILLPEVQIIAKDLDTGADISKTVKAITTAFNDPILGQLSGIVE